MAIIYPKSTKSSLGNKQLNHAINSIHPQDKTNDISVIKGITRDQGETGLSSKFGPSIDTMIDSVIKITSKKKGLISRIVLKTSLNTITPY